MVGNKGEQDMFLAALYLLVAGGLAYGATLSKVPTLGKIFLALAALLFTILAAGMLVQGLREFGYRRQWEEAKIQERKVMNDPEIVKLNMRREFLNQLTIAPKQVWEILMNNPVVCETLSGGGLPVVSLKTKEGDVPYWVVDKFRKDNIDQRGNFEAIRYMDDVNGKATYMGRLYNHLIQRGYLVRTANNESARWASFPESRERFLADFYGDRLLVRDASTSAEDDEPDEPPQVVTV